MSYNQSSFIVNQHTTLDELITYLRQAYQVKSNYLSKDQFCYVTSRHTETGSWIVVNQEKSMKISITCTKDPTDLVISKRTVSMALMALGFKVKNFLD